MSQFVYVSKLRFQIQLIKVHILISREQTKKYIRKISSRKNFISSEVQFMNKWNKKVSLKDEKKILCFPSNKNR